MTLVAVLSSLLFVRQLCAVCAWLAGADNAFTWRRTFRREEDGAPYMVRRQLLRSPWVDIYLNQILTPDHDPYPHNHPWKRCYSLKLSGAYIERIYRGPGLIFEHWRVPGRWSRVPNIHRIEELIDGQPCWTLFFGVRRHKDWGFFELPGGRFVRHDQREPRTLRSAGEES